jgi:ABC-type uncharacterized transport system ATPase subunit
MRTIATLQDSDTGSIDLDGLNVLTQKDEVRMILGYLPQEFGVCPKLSAYDMLQHLAVMKGVTNKTERKQMVEAILNQINLWSERKKALSTYSGGMKTALRHCPGPARQPEADYRRRAHRRSRSRGAQPFSQPAQRYRIQHDRHPFHPHR